jgi:hypothetical protein
MALKKLTLCLALAVLFAVPAGASNEEFPAPGYFLGRLTPDASWDAIQKTTGMKADFPYIAFGPTLVPLSSVCVDGDMLAIADPRIDTGVRISAEPLRAQVDAAAAAAGAPMTGSSGQLAASSPTSVPPGIAMQYPVSVYNVTERGIRRSYVFLFDKLWPIPTCPAR